jgi:hypothetical protein
MTDDDLVAQVRPHALAEYGPASEAAVAAAEKRLGFPFPPLLRRLYLEVGNGGFGPEPGLFGVEGGHVASVDEDGDYTVDDFYAMRRADGWPERLLAIVDWGCETWICIDCRVEHGKIVVAVEDGFWASELTLPSFFEAWLEGVDLNAQLFEPGKERVGVNPFTKMPMVFRSPGEPKGRKWP